MKEKMCAKEKLRWIKQWYSREREREQTGKHLRRKWEEEKRRRIISLLRIFSTLYLFLMTFSMKMQTRTRERSTGRGEKKGEGVLWVMKLKRRRERCLIWNWIGKAVWGVRDWSGFRKFARTIVWRYDVTMLWWKLNQIPIWGIVM